ncbi:endoribonuclease MazF [Paenibacillus glacialis]|uniref:mRNA-degrading endonuclease n=1 Tax=Paenibacillus glacialis TaxID=494026 RepID=A0A168LJX1_9BACL|nr:endoribonuclease MazF [Paenibacillus glacialis]OAB43489.1 mRNA-degrading endonuclease [Paenibacillus glacialis]
MIIPDRGDLVYLSFDPQAGHEQAGRRPAIVLSPKAFNQATGFATFCPITNQSKGYPFEVKLTEEGKITGVILSDQIKTLDWKARRCEIVGQAHNSVTQEVLDKIHTFLN